MVMTFSLLPCLGDEKELHTYKEGSNSFMFPVNQPFFFFFFKDKKGCLNLQINSFNVWKELEKLKLPFLFYVWNCALLYMHAFRSPSLAWNWNRPTWELIWQTGLSPESLWKLNLMKSHTYPKPASLHLSKTAVTTSSTFSSKQNFHLALPYSSLESQL